MTNANDIFFRYARKIHSTSTLAAYLVLILVAPTCSYWTLIPLIFVAYFSGHPNLFALSHRRDCEFELAALTTEDLNAARQHYLRWQRRIGLYSKSVSIGTLWPLSGLIAAAAISPPFLQGVLSICIIALSLNAAALFIQIELKNAIGLIKLAEQLQTMVGKQQSKATS